MFVMVMWWHLGADVGSGACFFFALFLSITQGVLMRRWDLLIEKNDFMSIVKYCDMGKYFNCRYKDKQENEKERTTLL